MDLRSRLEAVLGGAYRVERELGGGGMSRVFLAEETGLGRQVVVKVLPPDLAAGINAERFQREIHLAASLQHPHIVPLLAAGGSGDLFYYTMPLIEGESLRAQLAQKAPLPVREAVRVLRDVADALAHAHARGIVHRDIKPDNVMLSHQHALVADFGVAKAVSGSGGDGHLTTAGVTLGTPAYMSPEQAAGDPQIDGRADIYALGAMAYEMLSGRPPFVGLGPVRLIAAHVTEQVRPLLEVSPTVPPDVANLVMRCLEKDPTQRPQSAADVRDALDLMALPTPRALPAARRPRRLGWVAAGALAVLGVAVWAGLRSRSTVILDPNRVAVVPFDVLDPALSLWHEGLVDVLSRTLDGAGPLRTVSPTLVVRRWQGRADAASATALGRETGAHTVVFGGLVGAGTDSVRLNATVLDVARGVTLAEVELRDRSARMDRVADSLAVRVLRELGRTLPLGVVRGTPLGSTSMPALKAFLQGEQFLRRSQWDSSLAYHQRAFALDSTFALAWSHAGLALGWSHSASDTLSLKYKIRAGSLNHGLAPRESLIVQAESLAAAVYGDGMKLGVRAWPTARRMLATLSVAVQRYPTDPELWYMLGDARYHAGMFAGLPREQSLDAFDRSIALDSAFTPSYVHAIQLALELRGPEAARTYATDYLQAGAEGDYATGTRLLLRLFDPKQSRSEETLRLLDSMPMMGLHNAFHTLVGWADTDETAIWVGRRHRDRMMQAAKTAAESTDATVVMNGMLSVALAFRGHLRDAAPLALANPGVYAQLALLGAIPPESAATTFRGWLAWSPKGRAYAGWALPWLTDRRDTAGIARIARWADSELRHPSRPRPPIATDILGYLAHASRAYFALARGDSVNALAQFEALPDTACFSLCDLDRLVRIKLLAARGRDRDAARLLTRTPGRDGPGDPISIARVLWELERGRVNERLGDRAAAREGYAYVAAAWVHADSTLLPYVNEARAGLARLSGESTVGRKPTEPGAATPS
jgi:serine/threonine-protein kinase